MLGLGAWELAMVMVVALVVLGPDKIPEVARKLARFLGQARRMADDVRRNVDEAIQDAEPKNSPPAGAFTEWLERQQARDHAAPDGTFEAAPDQAAQGAAHTAATPIDDGVQGTVEGAAAPAAAGDAGHVDGDTPAHPQRHVPGADEGGAS